VYCNGKVLEFVDKFRQVNKVITCREILGYNLAVKKEADQAKEKNLFKTTCNDMVICAVGLLEELGY
jgi:Putative redox-active protein (C_GCAxxG_C_C).